MNPGIVLSFDDSRNISSWLDACDLFSRYDARATFFIEAPDRMDKRQWEGLRELVSQGHAVGCHGMRHEKAVDYCRIHGTDCWLQEEVLPALKSLEDRGFEVSAFVYPYSQCDAETNDALKKYFDHARTGIALQEGQPLVELDDIFKPAGEVLPSFLLQAKSLDRCSDTTSFEKAIFRAVSRNEVLFAYGHGIGDKADLTNIRFLEEFLVVLNSNGLRFYTYDDFPSEM